MIYPLKPSSNFLLTVEGSASFMDPICYLCFVFVFVILSCLFVAALWSPAGKGLTYMYIGICKYIYI